jgi:hypothetical protein
MNSSALQREFQELLTATKEQFKYFQELGVEEVEKASAVPAFDGSKRSPEKTVLGKDGPQVSTRTSPV